MCRTYVRTAAAFLLLCSLFLSFLLLSGVLLFLCAVQQGSVVNAEVGMRCSTAG